jgi:hypothetical protein
MEKAEASAGWQQELLTHSGEGGPHQQNYSSQGDASSSPTGLTHVPETEVRPLTTCVRVLS